MVTNQNGTFSLHNRVMRAKLTGSQQNYIYPPFLTGWLCIPFLQRGNCRGRHSPRRWANIERISSLPSLSLYWKKKVFDGRTNQAAFPASEQNIHHIAVFNSNWYKDRRLSYDSRNNISLSKKHLMEKGLANPNWLVTTRITPSFPWKYFQSYNEITNAASTAKQTIPFLSAPNPCQPQVHNP